MALPIPGWRPTDDVWFCMDDKTGERCSPAQLQALLDDLTEVANKHGFDQHHYGTGRAMMGYFKTLLNA
jgi:hypothetical protein